MSYAPQPGARQAPPPGSGTPSSRPYAPMPSAAARPSAAAGASGPSSAAAAAALAASRKRAAADGLSADAASLRAAKRGRPTSRALPPSLSRVVPESAMYADLLRIERAVDWTVARKRAEVGDSLSRTPKMKRTLRIFLSNTCANQTFQRDDADAPAAGEDGAAAEGDATGENGDAAKPAAAAAASGSGDDKIPSWTLRIEGRLMEPVFRSRAASSQAATAAAARAGSQRFSNLVRTVVVELQRDAALYPAQSNIVEWHRPVQTALPDRASAATGPAGTGEPPLISAGEPSLDGLEIKRSGSSPVKARIVLYPAHTPERYALAPELAALLDVREETRAGIIAALWGYVKARSLLDENDRRYIRCDEALGRIFKTERIAFHHVPEVINRHLHPAQPIVLEYWIRTDVAEHKHQTAYDIELDLDDWATRKAREKVMDAFEPAGEAAAEISELDDRIAQASASLHTHALARDFLATFAQSPQAHLRSWLASQSRDLDIVLGAQIAGAAAGGGAGVGAGIGDEEMRRAETFKGKWVDEAVIVHESARYAERLQGLQSQPALPVTGPAPGMGGMPPQGMRPGGGGGMMPPQGQPRHAVHTPQGTPMQPMRR